MTRAGSMIAQQWRQFGIDAKIDRRARHAGRRDGPPAISTPFIGWSVETWGGHPDLSFFLDSWHSQFVAKPGKAQPPATGSAGPIRASTRSSRRSARSASTIPRASSWPGLRQARCRGDADHPADGLQCVHSHGHDLLDRISRRRKDPYTDPVPNWGNTKYMLVKLKPAKARRRWRNAVGILERAARSPPPRSEQRAPWPAKVPMSRSGWRSSCWSSSSASTSPMSSPI